MSYILAIDMGTTHCKAVIFDTTGKALQSFKSGYDIISKEPGQSEQNPDEIFNAVLQLIQQAIEANKKIQAISFSAAMHSIIAVDKAGNPLTNAIIWADTRSTQQAEALKQSEIGKVIYQKTGTPIHPMSPLCKIIWMRETMPEIVGKADKFISLKEYVFAKLFGKYVIDYSIASATGLFDIHQLDWCKEALEVAGITADKLSLPVEVTHSESNLLPHFRQQLPTEQPLQFIIGGNDGCLANLGSGAITPGDAALTIGTSGAVRMTATNITPDNEQRVFTYLLTKNIFVTGGAINNGGITAEWLSKQLMNDNTPKDLDVLLQAAATAPAGSGNLLFLPYLLGERAPMWDANAKGVLFGLTQQHTKAHIARAAIEGVCFAMRSVVQAIEEVNGEMNHIYASGGFTQSSFWLQTMADILGKDITINNSADASATGAAIIAMYALGYVTDITAASQLFAPLQVYRPNIALQKQYNALFHIFQSLYPKLKDDFSAISHI